MSVYDMGSGRIQAEFTDDAVNYLFIINQLVVVILFLYVKGLISYKISLKGSHFFLAVYRRILIRPDIPHDILAAFSLFTIYRTETFSYIAFQHAGNFRL